MTFEGIVGSSFMGDLAIDGVSITNGSCHGKTTPTVLPSFTSSCAFGIFLAFNGRRLEETVIFQ